MNDFYAPIGPQTKLSEAQISRPLGANVARGLTGVLFLLLVPLLYVAIFRARKKHAMTIGEWHNTVICFMLIHQESLRERELGGQIPTPSGPRFTLVLGS